MDEARRRPATRRSASTENGTVCSCPCGCRRKMAGKHYRCRTCEESCQPLLGDPAEEPDPWEEAARVEAADEACFDKERS